MNNRIPADPVDELVRQAYSTAPGAPEGFAEALHRRMAKAHPAPKSSPAPRLLYLWIGLAAAAVLAVAVLVIQFSGNNEPETPPGPVIAENRAPDRQPGAGNEAFTETPETPDNEQPSNGAVETPEQPETPEDPDPQDDPGSHVETPEQPETPEDPDPRDDPGSHVETPEQPETPKDPDPTDDPGSHVETPEQPEDDPRGTEVPDRPREVLALVAATGGGKLKFRYGAEEDWKEAVSGNELFSGVSLDARGEVDLNLAGGALLRFDGEIALSRTESESLLTVDLADKRIYADNLGAACGMRIRSGKLEASLADGAAFFEESSSALRMACFHGDVKAGEELLAAGFEASLKKGGLARVQEIDSGTVRERLLRDLPARTLFLDDFDKPETGLQEGTGTLVEGEGYARGSDPVFDSSVAGMTSKIHYALPGGPHRFLPGEVIRLRFRVRGTNAVIFQVRIPELSDNYGVDLSIEQGDEWQEIELPLTRLLDRSTYTKAAAPGMQMTHFHLVASGGEKPCIEIDRIEFVRYPELD